MSRLAHANLGRNLETIVMSSQMNTVILFQVQTGTRMVRGNWIKLKSPPDFYGSVCATGRLINFDAKQQGEKYRFYFYKPGKKPRVFVGPYQRECLIRAGQRGNGIAGLLIEATHPDVKAYFWLSWRNLFTSEASIEWTDRRMVPLGSSYELIRFERVIAGDVEANRGAA